MASDQHLPRQFAMSVGGESIPFTMQAEASHMTIDEAIASGLFDLPDEPGMVRIPISMNVMIPMHLLQPSEPPAADDNPDDPYGLADDDEPGGRVWHPRARLRPRTGRRFGTCSRRREGGKASVS